MDINEDGSLIAISGERQVRETVMVGWKVVKKDTEIKGFKKVFRIPDGVILDKIKAKFNEDEATLTITMPKKNRGLIGGTYMEEVKEKVEELVKQGSGSLQIVDEKSLNAGTSETNGEEIEQVLEHNPVSEYSNREDDDDDDLKNGQVENLDQEPAVDDDIQQGRSADEHDRLHENENRIDDHDDVHEEEEKVDEEREAEPGNRARCKMCIPIVAVGSTLLVSLLVFVFQFVRSKNQTSRRRD